MGDMLSKPAYWDIEVMTLSRTLESGLWDLHEYSTIRGQIEERKAQILAGLGSAAQVYWTAKVRLEVDEYCRVRRDPIHGWMLDRWIDQFGCWHPIGYIGAGGRLEIGQDGVRRVVGDRIRPDLIRFLREHDMQRPGYLEDKRARQAAVRLANEQRATDRVLKAIDSLTDKRIKEFIEVERAVQTGDTVIMRGETRKMFDRMVEAGRQAPEGPVSGNPGMHPLRHRRKYRKGKHEPAGSSTSDTVR